MKPPDLLRQARQLVPDGLGKPSQTDLRRAISAAYYALFHCLARNNADLLIGASDAARSKPAWRQAYRALEHGTAKKRCTDPKIARFPTAIQNFAATFARLQQERHDADYLPDSNFKNTEVITMIANCEQAINDFQRSKKKDRLAFAAWILFPDRK